MENTPASADPPLALSLCSACRTPNPDWLPQCFHCGTALPQPELAVRAEVDHIAYLLTQLPWWQSRHLLSPEIAAQLHEEYASRQSRMRAQMAVGKPSDTMGSALAPPIVPPLPPDQTYLVTEMQAAITAKTSSHLYAAAIPIPTTPPNLGPTSQPQQQRPHGAPGGTVVFLQEHALKIVFALATVLVLIALRSILGWNESNAVFLKLLPILPLGLTAMFGQFGRRTQQENPWAAFVYQGLAAALIGFDLFLVDRFWLPTLGVSISPKPLFLVVCAAPAAMCGLLWHRNRYPAMWHLWQTGILTTLFAALQCAKTVFWNQTDWRPTPLLLFGLVYLGAALLYFSLAAQNRPRSAEEGIEHAGDAKTRRQAQLLWANLCVTAAFILCAFGQAWDTGLKADDLLLVILLAGALYGFVAQALSDARLVYVAAILCLGSGLVWVRPHMPLSPSFYGALFLAVSTIALALHTYNRGLAGRRQLADAWQRVALVGSTLGLVMVGGQTLLSLTGVFPAEASGVALLRAGLALLCGLQFLFASVQESEAALGYPAFLAGGIALIGMLQTVHAGFDRYPLALAVYACLLLLPSFRRSSTPVAPGSQPTRQQPLQEVARICGQIAIGASLLASTLLALVPNHSVWIAMALLLDAVLSATLGSQDRASHWRYAALFSAAFATALITQRLLAVPITFADSMLPFVFLSATSAFFASLTHPKSPAHTDAQRLSQKAMWREPLADAGLIALGVTLLTAWIGLLFRTPQPLPALDALVCVTAAILLAASRSSGEKDARRIGALALLNVGTALCIAHFTGLGAEHGPADVVVWQHFHCGLLLQAWVFWIFAKALYNLSASEVWSEDLARIAMAPAALSGLLTAISLFWWSAHAHAAWVPPMIVIGGAFLLLHLEMLRSRQIDLLALSVGMLVAGGIASVNAPEEMRFHPALTLAVFTVLSAGSYLQLAKRLQAAPVAYLSTLPLLGGVTLALLQRVPYSLLFQDVTAANAIWVIGGVALSGSYLAAAQWSGRSAFSSLSGIVLACAYLRAITWAIPLPGVWDGLLLLPLFVGMAALALRPSRRWKPFQRAYLEVAVAGAGLALVATILVGDGRIGFSQSPTQDIVTATLASYGVAYLVLAAIRMTASPLAAAATVLTLAYLNLLLSQTQIISFTSSTLSWPLFAFLFIQAALVWIGVGVLLKTRLKNPALAHPVLMLAQCIALVSAVGAIFSLPASHQGSLGILTLAWASATWFGLWALDQGEIYLHIGAGNMLIAWCATVYHTLGAELNLLDVYLLPFGLYLLLIGHQMSRKGRLRDAQTYWYTGLLVTLAPALLTRWMQAPGWHVALLLSECIVCVLWGVSQRIRAFVAVGLGTVMLYAASVTLGSLPDTTTTILALLVGVGLFVFGFYALTHREAMKRAAGVIQQRWVAWHLWR